MRLEYRILEIAQGNEQECNFCFLDFDDPTLLNFDTAPVTHQMMANNTPDGYSDIIFICSECQRNIRKNSSKSYFSIMHASSLPNPPILSQFQYYSKQPIDNNFLHVPSIVTSPSTHHSPTSSADSFSSPISQAISAPVTPTNSVPPPPPSLLSNQPPRR
ncbi:11697_t:CDS:2, partial [Entrophospora sp. SA101]